MARHSQDSLISAGVTACKDAEKWLSVHQWASITGISDATIRRYFPSWADYLDTVKARYHEKHGVPEWEVEQQRRRESSSLLASFTKQTSATEVLARRCEAAIAKLPKLVALPKPKARKGRGEPQQMHLIISDVHIGEKTDPMAVGGLGGYDFEAFKKRLAVLEEKVHLFHSMLAAPMNIQSLVVNFLGDIVTGEIIYPGQQLGIDKILVDQVFEGVEYFSRFLQRLAGVFPTVSAFGIWGNHGRAGRKYDGVSTRTNFDYISYRCLADRLKPVTNIEWYISECPFLIVQHGEHNFYLHHGDNVRGWMGLPYYGLDRKVRKVTSMTGIPIHYLMIGHHHREATISIPHGRLFVNGAWPGGSELSINQLDEAAIPKQILYVYHPKEGVHSVSDIHLAPPIKLSADKDGLYTPVYRGDNGRQAATA